MLLSMFLKVLDLMDKAVVSGIIVKDKPASDLKDRRSVSLSHSSGSLEESDCVFIVHGRDDSTKKMVDEFLEELGLKTIILHEKPDRGRTIIGHNLKIE